MARNGGPVDLRFPVGGVARRYGYQYQAPYTTPDALNVRPYDTLEGRERGGSRPGTVKSFALQLGAPSPVQLLAPVSYVDDATQAVNTKMVAVSNGALYRENPVGTLEAKGGSVNVLSSLVTVQAAERGQKLDPRALG